MHIYIYIYVCVCVFVCVCVCMCECIHFWMYLLNPSIKYTVLFLNKYIPKQFLS